MDLRSRSLRAAVALAALAAAGLALPSSAQTAGAGQSFLQLKIGGFTDFNFATSDAPGGSSGGFEEGQFVLHFNTRLGSKVSFFGELSLTARDSEFRTEVERAHLSYLHSDALKLSAGRFHTPINWWNTAFHHGLWLQTTVSRPEMTQFGGVFIPVHFVGALVEGTLGAGGTNLGYAVGIGNGRSENPARGGDAGDVNNNRAWLAGWSVRPDRVYDLQVGAAFYGDQISLAGVEEIREHIVSAYVVWLREQPEFIAEYTQVDHRGEITGESWRSDAFYLQLAYRLPWAQGRFKPYLRYEDLEVDAGDPVFSGFAVRARSIAGLRCDFYPAPVALKLEVRREEDSGRADVDVARAQISYAF